MIQTRLPYSESPESVLEACVVALGGWQRAAHELWPTEDPLAGGRRLRCALDPERRERLSEPERERLIVLGAQRGCLDPIVRLCRLCGLSEPQPLDPEREEARAIANVSSAVAVLEEAMRSLREARELPRVQSIGSAPRRST